MGSFRRWAVFTVLLAAIATLNYWYRKKEPFAYAEMPGYNRLYAVSEQTNMKAITSEGDSVRIGFTGDRVSRRNHFEFFCEGRKIGDRYAADLALKPLPGWRTYTLRVNETDSFTVILERSTDRPTVTYFYSGPFIKDEPLSARAWAWDGDPGRPGEDKERLVLSYLKDSMHILPGDLSREKVIKISTYILALTAGRYGTPSDSMSGLTPIQQLNCVREGRSRLYCGNYATIFSFFANKANIPTRYIDCGVAGKYLEGGPHAFNEAYLEEAGRWAYVDLTDGNIFVRKNGQYLNAIDIQRLLQYDLRDSGFSTLHFRGDSLAELPFTEGAHFGLYCFGSGQVFNFYYGNYTRITRPRGLWEKIGSFLYPRPYYAMYSDGIVVSRSSFFIRLITQYAFVAGLLLWMYWTGILVYRFFRIKKSGK